MNKDSFDFLRRIEETPSVSGYEAPVAKLVRDRMKKWADHIETDVHGNVIIGANTKKGGPRVMLAGHMDQIGVMVHYISDDGFCYFKAVGGIDPSVMPGLRITIHGKNGPVPAVIGRKPVHLMKENERGAKVELTELWLDIGAANKEEALKKVAIGDVGTFSLGVQMLGEDLITSPGLDNKVGTFVVMEALRIAAESKKLKCALYAVATVQEEIGLRGARTSCYGIDPLVGIAVDVTHGTDNPGADKKLAGDIKLGKGAVIERGPNINHKLYDLFVETAQQKKIAHQLAAAPGATGTDANAIQISRAGVATGLIGIPNRYMHTPVEVCSLADLEACAELMAQTVLKIDGKTSFVPE
ncbi:MAG: M42 family metallopeptidase [Tepidisphaeraceae bacterium]